MGTRLNLDRGVVPSPGELAVAARSPSDTAPLLAPHPAATRSRLYLGPNDNMPHSAPPSSLEIGAVAYWCGTFSDAPVQNVLLGGISFPRFTERIVQPEGSLVTKRFPQFGAVQYLTPAQIEKIKEATRNRAVRWAGSQEVYREIVMTEQGLVTYERTKPRTGWVVMRDGRYRPHVMDEPLGRYVYCLPVEDAARTMGAHWQSGDAAPPSLEP